MIAVGLAALVVGCGGSDDQPATPDAAPDGAVNATPIDVVFEGESFTLTGGVASNLGTTVLDIGAQTPFGIVLSDQVLSCSTDLAARPPEGMYAIVYLDSADEGTFTPATVTLLKQTSGPRTSSTRTGGTTVITALSPDRVAGTADHDYAPDENSSIIGSFDVPRCR